MLNRILKWLDGVTAAKQCVQCGKLSSDVFCDRHVCRFVEIRACEKCGKRSPCYGLPCPLAERIARNARGCRDAVEKLEKEKAKWQ